MAAAVEPVTTMAPKKANGSISEAPRTPQTLVDKIAEACNAVGGIEKKGRNTKHGYDYVMAADVAAAFRHELFTRGIVLLQDEESAEFTSYETNSGGMMQECRLKVRFTLRDNTGELSVCAFGVGRDTFDKAIYKAKTGATKYFLRGLGLIPDKADDPEKDGSADQEVHTEGRRETPVTPDNYPPRKPASPDAGESRPVGSIAPFQKTAILNACKKSGKGSQQLNDYLHKTFGYDALEEMPKKDFQQALKWAMEA